MDLESLENCTKSLLKIVLKFIFTEVAKDFIVSKNLIRNFKMSHKFQKTLYLKVVQASS